MSDETPQGSQCNTTRQSASQPASTSNSNARKKSCVQPISNGAVPPVFADAEVATIPKILLTAPFLTPHDCNIQIINTLKLIQEKCGEDVPINTSTEVKQRLANISGLVVSIYPEIAKLTIWQETSINIQEAFDTFKNSIGAMIEDRVKNVVLGTQATQEDAPRSLAEVLKTSVPATPQPTPIVRPLKS